MTTTGEEGGRQRLYFILQEVGPPIEEGAVKRSEVNKMIEIPLGVWETAEWSSELPNHWDET